ncbi:hypothetical protein Skr01_26170 [Sphaerisporangium krabiense]|uniref:Uncharacterized protein n=1 Tax=Sphaerisporangium krabiense TaxID=763782 RepID=A0A7W8ZAP1_9ACTN|nr:hypothetical protein [Sphaerisporangium krabiense]MBB5630514.1 hypothetical protein [Sphaerisporangium krabiense]GII62532.1 hypothetical protein Skr01_26170 [Sphaerisporangium krabiense]
MIEDDLREALRARAATYPADPRAWDGVQRRLTRARRRSWATLAAVPLAAGAVLGGASLVVMNAGGQTTTATTSPTTSPSGDDAYETETATRPPIGATLTLDDPAVNRPMRLWFAARRDGAPGVELCVATQTPRGGSSAGCQSGDDLAGHPGERARLAGQTGHGWPLPERRTAYGTAVDGVTGVAAVRADGARIEGRVHRLPGAPLAIWTVTYPYGATADRYEFSGAGGEIVQTLQAGPDVPEPVGASDARPVGAALRLPAGPVARMYDDGSLVWRLGDRIVGADFAGNMAVSPPDGHLSDGVTTVPVASHFAAGQWFGYARAGTARVELTLPRRRTIHAATVSDPWQQDVVLFATPVEPGEDVNLSGYRIRGLDRTGKELWHHDEPAHPPLWLSSPIPGTEPTRSGPRPAPSGPDRTP